MNMKSLLFFVFPALTLGKTYCQRGEACWPTDAEIQELEKELNPEAARVLKWDGKPKPRVCSVPITSADDQPLYGFGVNGLNALYADSSFDTSNPCFSKEPEVHETRDLCMSAIRNNPLESITPGFVVWALKAEHVQAAVNFARKFNLCVMVAGTGHDFINRHSCKDGMFIRTTLLKEQEWDLDDKKGFHHPDGNVKLGAGTVFSEAHKTAADHGRFVASGWAITVGIAGWSIGGGHGPFGQAVGLGVDNLLEVDVVLADGTLVTANEDNDHKDLFWAIRGGGGSTWGVITAFTLKAHKVPEGGITKLNALWVGSWCNVYQLDAIVDAQQKWSQTLDSKWSGIAFFQASKNETFGMCGATWYTTLQYVFLGSAEEAMPKWKEMKDSLPVGTWQLENNVVNKPDYYKHTIDYGLEPIIPVEWTSVGVVSVLVQREKVANGDMGALIKEQLHRCPKEGVCNRHELYHDITGAEDSPRDPNVSVSPNFRKAMFHYVFSNDEDKEKYYTLGENSYLSESAYKMEGWEKRLWGENYPELLRIKKKYDPNNVFWCKKCVGDESSSAGTKLLRYSDFF